MKSNATGLRRILKAFTYSYDGFVATFKTEAAFRQDLLFCAFALIVALILPVTLTLRLLMIYSLFCILLMELINSAIEATIDRIGEKFHPLSKKAKDIGSLLVLIAFIQCFVIFGLCIFIVF